MSTEQNKEIAYRAIDELWNSRNPDVINELYAEDFHESAWQNRRAYRDFAAGIFAAGAPPDMHIAIEDQIAEGDKVVTRWTWGWTQSGEFFGAAPNGKYISFTGISIFRLEDGKIVEGWFNNDWFGVQQQLGLIG
jgi:steroid delta-isomerase-like uncharacterized protein